MLFFTNKKKKYFLHKLDGVQKMIWDLEFKREKSLMVREEVRQTYDNTQAKLFILLEKIKSQLLTPEKICEVHNPEVGKEKIHKDKGVCACEYKENSMPVPEIEKLYDQKELFERDLNRYKAQMKQVDVDVGGSPKTNEYPDGEDGINQQLDALRELKGMVKDYLKKI